MDKSMDKQLERLTQCTSSTTAYHSTQQQPRSLPKLTSHHPSSTAATLALIEITWKDLKPNTRHYGEIIYLRIGGTRRDVGSVFSVTDSRGVKGDVWSLVAQPLGIELATNTSVVAIREPYYGNSPRGNPAICLHHPTDCKYVARAPGQHSAARFRLRTQFPDLEVSNEVKYRTQGDDAVIRGDFLGALDFYTLGEGEDGMSTIPLRSATHARMGAFHMAFREAHAMNMEQLSAGKPAALNLAMVSALRCDMPGLARQYVTQLIEQQQDPYYRHVEFHQRALERVQQAAGHYDFGMLVRAVTGAGNCPEVSSYTGNLEVRPSELSGRGMFAIRDVVAGELLLCEKPAALVKDSKNSEFGDGMLDVLPGEKTSGRVLQLLSQLAAKIIVDPAAGLTEKIFSMCAGHEYHPTNDGDHFNTYHALWVLKHNQYTILPGCTSDHHDRGDPANRAPANRALPSAADQMPGFWLKASMFNHSCLPNCCWSWIGDIFIVRAIKGIPAGEELTLAYVPNSYDLAKRRGILQRNNGFECSCPLCVADLDVVEKILLQRKMLQSMLKPGVMLAVNDDVVEQMMQTYASTCYDGLPKVQMADAFLQLANVKLGDIRNWKSASQEAKKAADECFVSCLQVGLGITIVHDHTSDNYGLVHGIYSQVKAVGVLALMGLAELAFHAGAIRQCRALKSCARELYKVLYGEDDSFEGKHPSYGCREV